MTKIMTVADLKDALKGVPDDAAIRVFDNEYADVETSHTISSFELWDENRVQEEMECRECPREEVEEMMKDANTPLNTFLMYYSKDNE